MSERTVKDKIVCQIHWTEKMTVLRTFLEFSLNFLSNNLETLQNLVQTGRKAGSKFELPVIQFERTVREKIACKTHLQWETDCFKNTFGILIKFPIQ